CGNGRGMADESAGHRGRGRPGSRAEARSLATRCFRAGLGLSYASAELSFILGQKAPNVMAILPSNFWSDNYYNPPPLTDDALSYAESFLNVRLPVKYIELLRIQNGGSTKGFGYPMRTP